MKIYLIVGERSGDQHAAKIVKELKKDKNIIIRGWGGDDLKSQGMHLDRHIDEVSYMGFWEVIKITECYLLAALENLRLLLSSTGLVSVLDNNNLKFYTP